MRTYEKPAEELTMLDKLRLLNGAFHRVNLMLGEPQALNEEKKNEISDREMKRRAYRERMGYDDR